MATVQYEVDVSVYQVRYIVLHVESTVPWVSNVTICLHVHYDAVEPYLYTGIDETIFSRIF